MNDSETKYANWSEAPEGAEFHTVDKHGKGTWWSRKPVSGCLFWFSPKPNDSSELGKIADHWHGPVDDWKSTLEPRPKELFRKGDKVRIKPGKPWTGTHSSTGKYKWQPEGTKLSVAVSSSIAGGYLVEDGDRRQSISGDMLEPYPEEPNAGHCPDSADEKDGGILAGAELYRAIAEAMDAGEDPEVFEWRSKVKWVTPGTFDELVSESAHGYPVRRAQQPAMSHLIDAKGVRHEFPAPMSEEPERGTLCWFTFRGLAPRVWHGTFTQKSLLADGRCFATEEGWDAHEKAFLEASKAAKK